MKDLAQVDINVLKAAVKALNEAELLPEKIKFVKVQKKDLIPAFTAGVEQVKALDKVGELPPACVAMYNDLYSDEVTTAAEVPEEPATAAAEEEEEEEEKPAAPPKPKGQMKKKGERGEKFLFVQGLIQEGTHTRKEVVTLFLEKWPETAKATVGTLISDGKNPKYNKFPHLVVVAEDGKISFQA